MTAFLFEELKAALAHSRKPLVICGAGTSIYSTNRKAPSWRELIESGISRVLGLAAKESKWAAYSQERLGSNDAKEWIAVADEVTQKIGGADGAEMARWLRDCFSPLNIARQELYDAIVALDCPIATTNYDTLISEATGLPPVSWSDADAVLRILKGEQKGVIHLHGVWSEPDSVVLGTLSYHSFNANSANILFRSIQALTRPTLMIGCGIDGVNDPDFQHLTAELANWPKSTERKYWLVRESDDGATPDTDLINNLYPVTFGKSFDDLPEFILSLTKDSGLQLGSTISLQTIDNNEPNPLLFGREKYLDEIVEALLEGTDVFITGAPGIGKTALATSAFYDTQVKEKFGDYRFFVSLDQQTGARAMPVLLCKSLNLPSTSDVQVLIHQIRNFTESRPVAVIFDNCEGIFENDLENGNRQLKLLSQIANLSIIATTRSSIVPPAGAYVIDDLPPLSMDAARSAFVSAAGRKFEDDPILAELLTALDGHALSINLVGAQARSVINLPTLLEKWRCMKAAMLKSPNQDEGRLTSVRASLALSLQSPLLQKAPLARNLIKILSELADGADLRDCVALLSGNSIVTKARAVDAISTLRELRLVEYKPDNRVRMLNPIRESVRIDLPSSSAQKATIANRFAVLSKLATNLSEKTYALIDSKISPIFNNVEHACVLSFIDQPFRIDAFSNLMGLLEYILESGRPVMPWWNEVPSQLANQQKYKEASRVIDKISEIHHLRGNDQAAIDNFKRFNNIYNLSTSPVLIGNIYNTFASIYMTLSDHANVDKYLKLAREEYEKCKPFGSGMANVFLKSATLAARRGQAKEATEFLEQADKIYKRVGDNLGHSNVLAQLAKLDWSRAPKLLEEANTILEGKGAAATISYIGIVFGDYLYKAGDLSLAERNYISAATAAKSSGTAANEAFATIRQGQCALVRGDTEIGNSQIKEGFDIWFALSDNKNPADAGFSIVRDSLMATSELSRTSGLKKAAEIWVDLERMDLVMEWAEFKFGDLK